MKPRIFIGSSVEALGIAYAIQENLTYDANVTTWDQGVFELSGNTLDALLKAINNTDFGIFVFKPDDITNIKHNLKHTVRDNVIFELGMFIGRLGKEKVFFVVPQSVKDFHLPSDLLGITYGHYDDLREDGNLRASLGSFCNQVRILLKNHTYNSINDLQNESKEAKRIAIEKPGSWKHLLAAEILEFNLIDIKKSYEELEKGVVFIKQKRMTGEEFAKWFPESIGDLRRMIGVLEIQFSEFNESLKSSEESKNILEIKTAVNYLISLSKELVAWEYRLQEVEPPQELHEIKDIMKGWSKVLFDNINIMPSELRRIVDAFNSKKLEDGKQTINFIFETPKGLERITEVLKEYYENKR